MADTKKGESAGAKYISDRIDNITESLEQALQHQNVNNGAANPLAGLLQEYFSRYDEAIVSVLAQLSDEQVNRVGTAYTAAYFFVNGREVKTTR